MPGPPLRPPPVASRCGGLPEVVSFLLVVSFAFAGAACGGPGSETDRARPEPARSPGPPTRIASLDLCADRYLLRLVPRERILAVSPDAGGAISGVSDLASGVPRVRPTAEHVLALDPDLVIRAWGGGLGVADLLRRAGVKVLQVEPGLSLADALARLESMAAELGAPERGAALVARMESRLAEARMPEPPSSDLRGTAATRALYLTPGGVTAGRGTLVGELIEAAGLANYETDSGWPPIPLERLAYDPPELVAAAFYDTRFAGSMPWSPGNHPVARARVDAGPTVFLSGASVSCAGLGVEEAVEALAAARRGLGGVPKGGAAH